MTSDGFNFSLPNGAVAHARKMVGHQREDVQAWVEDKLRQAVEKETAIGISDPVLIEAICVAAASRGMTPHMWARKEIREAMDAEGLAQDTVEWGF